MFSVRVIARRSRYWLCGCLALLVVPLGVDQTVEHVQNFSAFTGVQFLPGGYVVKDDEGQVEQYVYKDSKFVRFQGEVPVLLKDWTAYDEEADYLDQLDVLVPIPTSTLVPKRAKVKKFFGREVPGKGDILLICYTRKLKIEGSNTNDIFLTAALNPNPSDWRSEYHKLWTRKLQTETNYGDLQYQSIPGSGDFLLLYTEDVAADAVTHELDVYRIRGFEEPKARHRGRTAQLKKSTRRPASQK